MPLYEYSCEKCGKRFEVLQKFSDEPLTTHPDCGGKVERLVSPSAFHLKGGGWYATDYVKKSGASGEKSEGKSDSKGDGLSETKADSKASESKTDTKTESKPAATESPAKS